MSSLPKISIPIPAELVALTEIKKIADEIRSDMEAHNDLLQHKLEILQSILGNARDFLKEISINIKR